MSSLPQNHIEIKRMEDYFTFKYIIEMRLTEMWKTFLISFSDERIIEMWKEKKIWEFYSRNYSRNFLQTEMWKGKKSIQILHKMICGRLSHIKTHSTIQLKCGF